MSDLKLQSLKFDHAYENKVHRHLCCDYWHTMSTCMWFSCGLMRKTAQIPGWRPRSHCFLHRIINLPDLTAVSKMPCPRFLVFLGTSLGNPSRMTRVKMRRKERGHFGNLQKREGDKEARPTQQWIWMDKERIWMTTQSLRPVRAPNIHIPLPPQSGSQKPGCLWCTHSRGSTERSKDSSLGKKNFLPVSELI